MNTSHPSRGTVAAPRRSFDVTASRRETRNAVRHVLKVLRRAFAEFLAIPTYVIFVFLALAGSMIWLDGLRIQHGWPSIAPGMHEPVQTLLSTIATSIITVTSITFSLLLVAVQQGAAALTSQVYDQFLRRRANQVYFGFFVGLALYCLVTLAAVHPNYTPVYGAVVAFLLTVVALYLLILLIYSTIDQMRPVTIVQSIRKHTERARNLQSEWLAETCSELPPGLPMRGIIRIASGRSGFLTAIDVAKLRCAARDCLGGIAVVVLPSIGDYISPGQEILELRGGANDPATDAAELLLPALELGDQRDLDTDAGYGIEQIATIAWTSTSTAKSNPQPGMLACWNLRDLVGKWYGPEAKALKRCNHSFPIVYSDSVPMDLVRAFESLTVVASESMQHQTLATVYQGLAFSLRHVPDALAASFADISRRSLSALGDHVLTGPLQESLYELADALQERRMDRAAHQMRAACEGLAGSIGTLHSRATRSP